MPETNNYIICKGQAGLGNRILCLLTCILYAKLSKRTLIVDWRDEAYSDNKTNIFPHLFDNESIITSNEYEHSNSVNPYIWNGYLALSVLDLCRQHNIKITRTNGPTAYKIYSISLKNIQYNDQAVVFSSYTHKLQQLRKHFTGEFSGYSRLSNTAILSKLIQEELKPAAQVRIKVNDFVNKYFKEPTIGVHIRYTDRSTPLEKFHSAISSIRKNVKGSQIFLACDNQMIQKDFESRYKNIITTDKWLPEPGERIHYNPNKPDNLDVAIDALTDMYLLSRCNYLVYPSRSTFSYISHILSRLPEERVIDIDKWNYIVKIKHAIHTLA